MQIVFLNPRPKIWVNPKILVLGLAYIDNLDKLPFPAYDLFGDLKQYSHPQPFVGWRKPAIGIVTSRGCPHNCYFCYKGTFGNKWRPRSPENVVDEWEMLVREYKAKEICILDDNFNVCKKRVLSIIDLLSKRNIKTPWVLNSGIRADLVDDELLKALKEAGFYRVAIGVESGNQDILNYMRKKVTLEQLKHAFNLLNKHKIQTFALFVFGNPIDTKKTLQQPLDFSIKLNPTYAQYLTATPLPGTELYRIVKEQNILKIHNWSLYSPFNKAPYFDLPTMTGEEVNEFIKYSYKRFYFRLRFLINVLKTKDFYMTIPNYISGLFHLILKKSH